MDMEREAICEICGRSLNQVKCLNMLTILPKKEWAVSCRYKNESINVRLVCNECLSKYYNDSDNELWEEAYECVKKERDQSVDSLTDEEFLKWIRRLEIKKLMELSLILKGEIKCLTKTCFGNELEEMIFKDLQEVVKRVTIEMMKFIKGRCITVGLDDMEEIK